MLIKEEYGNSYAEGEGVVWSVAMSKPKRRRQRSMKKKDKANGTQTRKFWFFLCMTGSLVLHRFRE